MFAGKSLFSTDPQLEFRILEYELRIHKVLSMEKLDSPRLYLIEMVLPSEGGAYLSLNTEVDYNPIPFRSNQHNRHVDDRGRLPTHEAPVTLRELSDDLTE